MKFLNKINLKKIIIYSLCIAVISALVLQIIWANTALQLNTYTVESEKLPESFKGYRIAHVSDLHNAEIGDDNEALLGMLRDSAPDMIAITGDLIDSRNTDIEVALDFAEQAMTIAPCYYVSGNHEARISEYNALKEALINIGVVVLENEWLEIERDGAKILLVGVSDPSFVTDYLLGDDESVMKSALLGIENNNELFTLLLSHRPELFDVYSEHEVDLALTGHAHGGQIRLPLFGGLVAPNQGLFPSYDSGLYKSGNSNMIVSRGIGNSIIPLRINNRPEVIIVELT